MKKWIYRYVFFILGVAINSFGIAFVTKSAMGTSQISSIPYVFSLEFPSISFGMWTFLFNILFILLQVVLLKKDFHPIQFFQILVNVLFSGLIDLSMSALSFFQPEALWLRILSLLFGCLILALGICIEVAPDVLVVPGEGIVRALAQTTKIKFGTVKVYFDVTLIVIAGILSLLFFQKFTAYSKTFSPRCPFHRAAEKNRTNVTAFVLFSLVFTAQRAVASGSQPLGAKKLTFLSASFSVTH